MTDAEDDDRSLYDRILFGMSHAVWVPMVVAGLLVAIFG